MNLWFPIEYEVTKGYKYKKPKFESDSWQILEYKNCNLLLANLELYSKWLDDNLLENYMYEFFSFNNKDYLLIISDKENLLRPIEKPLNHINDNDAISFSLSIDKTREEIDSTVSLHDGVFLEKYSLILPSYLISEQVSDDYVLGNWVTGGVNVSTYSRRRILQLTTLKEETLIKITKKDAKVIRDDKSENIIYKKDDGINLDSEKLGIFTLSGRPELESFFNEYIVEIINNQARYNALGIGFPSAVILYGPPGSGKTYAVEQLINFLDWPSYRIEASSVASPYIHETSKKVAEIFDTAMQNSPSVLVIDEMEAFLSDRDNATSQHNIEEMAEFLRRIPEATENEVLIIAMTNKLDMIDPAILRRGRFDHIINVDYASTLEIESMIHNSLLKIASKDDIDINFFAKELSGRPLSDVAFFIKEGARLAARSAKDKLNNESLNQALESVKNREQVKKSNRVGFI